MKILRGDLRDMGADRVEEWKQFWDSDKSPVEVSRMNKSGKRELIRCLNRPITQKFAYLIIDEVCIRVHRKRINGRRLCAL